MSDLLERALEGGGFVRTDVRETLLAWLAADLLGDQYAALAQAGRSTDERVPLAAVFVDLPVGTRRAEDGKEEALPRTGQAYLATMLTLSERAWRNSGTREATSRFLLIGGPGQGKSTLVRFHCQLHRAAILERHGEASPPPMFALIDATLAWLRAGRGVGSMRRSVDARWPIRVEFRALAEWWARLGAPSPTLWDFLVHEVQATARREVHVDDLRLALKRVPILLVLDGLDEVAPTPERDAVVALIERFFAEAPDDGELAVVVTSRPQGLGRAFESFWAWHLSPLDVRSAAHCAVVLAEAWHPSQGREREMLVTRIGETFGSDTLASLLRTPLVVTIVTLLLARGGRLPQTRWELFERYYETLYTREVDRGTYASTLLADHRQIVRTVHEHVGLLLQAEGEYAARAGAHLDADRLVAVLRATLMAWRHPEASAQAIAEDLLRAVTERLVLLVEAIPGQWRFEVRSLQEFMAAGALMRSGVGDPEARLAAVALLPHWQQVVVLAVGSAFVGASGPGLRDAVTTGLFDRIDAASTALGPWDFRPSASLALLLLDDGAALRDPACGFAVLRRALRLLDEPSNSYEEGFVEEIAGLAARLGEPGTSALREALTDALQRAPVASRRLAWATAMSLAEGGDQAAGEIAATAWEQLTSPQRMEVADKHVDGTYPKPFEGRPSRWVWRRIAARVDELPATWRGWATVASRSEVDLPAASLEYINAARAAAVQEFNRAAALGSTAREAELVRGYRDGDLCGLSPDAWAAELLEHVSVPYRTIESLLIEDFIASRRGVLHALYRAPALPAFWRSRLRDAALESLLPPRSDLALPTRWTGLGLPLPAPAVPPASNTVSPWRDIVSLESLALTALRAFPSLSFAFSPPPRDKGQWTVLLGANGTGKTTVLRALALALIEPETSTAALRQAAPHRRDGALRATITLRLNGRQFGVVVNGDPRLETVRVDEATASVRPAERPWVIGYGCRRGSALGGRDREVSFSPADDVDTLFDGDRKLIHAETWLRQQKLAALGDPSGAGEARYRAIQRVLVGDDTVEGLLPGVKHLDVEPRDGRVRVSGPAIGDTTLAGLSDGYVTTAGWVIDLLARWLDRCDRDGVVADERFPEKMVGLVLIDEIDLNLHPLWQTRVIEATRRFFPRLSFVTTTHNPLTLVGARKGEVHVFTQDEPDGPFRAAPARPARGEPRRTGAHGLLVRARVRRARPRDPVDARGPPRDARARRAPRRRRAHRPRERAPSPPRDLPRHLPRTHGRLDRGEGPR